MGCVIPHQTNAVNIPHQTNAGLNKQYEQAYNRLAQGIHEFKMVHQPGELI
jgi:hypothetical protein